MMNAGEFREPFGEWAKSIQERLSYEYSASRSVLDQSTVLGTIREAVVRDILLKFLPRSVNLGSGQIVDVNGNLSNQVDVILAEGGAPAFRFDGGMSAFLCETVFATIEVKSMLYRDKMHEALHNSASVKRLHYSLHFRSKGDRIFDEAFEWVHSQGGLEAVEREIHNPTTWIDCPDHIWKVLPWIRYWLHWQNGDFRRRIGIRSIEDIAGADFDFFTHLLQDVLGRDSIYLALSADFGRAEEIEEEFLERLYKYLVYEDLPPINLVLAYGGYERIDNMVRSVRDWYEENREEVSWYELPRVIINHKMAMYRHYNEYHCGECDCPVMFFMVGICNVLTQMLAYERPNALIAEITPYFNVDRILGEEHPKYSPSYLVWSIPIDNSDSGEIIAPNQD